MKIYTLVYLKKDTGNENIALNGIASIQGYVNCCEALSNSLERRGFVLTILTNRPELIKKYLTNLVAVQQINFYLKVPEDIKFYSAHFKIDVFKWMSENCQEYSILVDNDVLCINEPLLNFDSIEKEKIPTYYDITDQVYPAYSREKIIKDKSIILKTPSIGNWAGGEYIGGTKDFFKNLYEKCMIYWPVYLENYYNLHHQGDEMLVSSAIESLQKTGSVFDIGRIGGIARHWSIKTLHISKPLEALYDHFLIHLPADKKYFSTLINNQLYTFPENYRKYLSHRE